MGMNKYGHSKDIPNEKQEILIGNLQPLTNYTVERGMRNKRGVGPAASVNITTTEKPEVRHDDETLKLIIASDYQILLQGSRFFYETPTFIYNSSDVITGIGIHVAKKLIFIADTHNIYRAPLSNSTLQSRVRIYATENTNQGPLGLSVDWLNNKLYILFESDTTNQKAWQISRCNFDGSHLQVVYGVLQTKPIHFQVDPFNGYLFWSFSSGSKSDGGLYRFDLSDVSNGVKHEIEPTRIFNQHDIGVFTIDYTNYKILAPIEELNTVISISMDSNSDKYIDIRNNTQTPMFHSIKSFALANDDLFYWSNGSHILTEEYHELSDRYYTSIYKEFAQLKHFIFFGMFPSAQPTPKPLNPPSNVQALLSVDRAKVSWHIPHLSSIQSRGAWQDWTYKLEVIDEENTNINQTLKEIKAIHYTVSDLKPNTKYRFRVNAYTNAGSGPYSVEYMGQTLKKADNREIVWSSHDGLIQSDILAEKMHTLIPQLTLNACNISNLEWFEDILYYVCGKLLYSFNRTTNDTKKLDVKDSVQAIAVDWIGRRLYWFNPLHQVLTRGNLINFESEILFALTAVEVDIKIDAIRGYLYFSTGNSVEYCRLNCNDKNRKKFYTIESFTGQKVMGLTLDFDTSRVYWIIRGYESAMLAIAPLIYDEYSTVVIEEFILTENKILGPLAYLSNRLMWLQDDHKIVVGNLTGKNLAHIENIKLSDLRAFLVIDKTQRNIPESDEPLNVIPEAVNSSTIQVTGKWNFFTIIWQPIETVNYGEVSYEIRYLNQTVVEKRPFFEIKDDKIPAHSQLNVTIKAFTYWASSVAVKKIVYSPSAPPSEPLEPRLFVEHVHNPLKDDLDIDVIFRWNTPKSVNGPLIGYKIQCWYVKDNIHHEKYNDYEMQPGKNEKYIEKVEKNATFYCKVRAETRAGVGNYSTLMSINTQNENPIPRLFAAHNDTIYIVDFDLKLHKSYVNTGSKVQHFCYIAFNKELFWTNENSELIIYSRDDRKKLYSMNALVLSLTVDWIERIVYWSQLESKGSTINAFNLYTKESKQIAQSPYLTDSLIVAPMNRQLFWIYSETVSSIHGSLATYNFDEEEPSTFLNLDDELIVIMNKQLFLGHEKKLFWLSEYYNLMSLDIQMKSSTSVNFTYQSNMMDLIYDGGRIYWTHNNKIYAENQLEQEPYEHIFFYKMKILAHYRQYYPSLHCLLPDFNKMENFVAKEIIDTALLLKLPVPKLFEGCSFVPMFWTYQIMYTQLQKENPQYCSPSTCHIIETNHQEITINNLKPFTRYQFQVSMSNYYTVNTNMSIEFSRPLIFKTKVGAPSQARITESRLNCEPNLCEIQLSWLQPIEINGPKIIFYEVQYTTKNKFKMNKNPLKISVKGDITSTNIKMLPNHLYIVWILAYTAEELYSKSRPFTISTPEIIKSDLPTAPGKPCVMTQNNEYEVIWEAVKSNSAIEYSLEGIRTVNESEPIVNSWTVFYRGADTCWKVKGLEDIAMYSFRVKARNAYGWSEYSLLSERIVPALTINRIHIAVFTLTVVSILIGICSFCDTKMCPFCEEFFYVNLDFINHICHDIDFRNVVQHLELCISKLKAMKEEWTSSFLRTALKPYSDFEPDWTSSPSEAQKRSQQQCEQEPMDVDENDTDITDTL
ncbi:proto-oncogene tyrosine-protein kinase ROS-like [Contarinia nasturtii]|uniref:proto-oncogene tyrosine-protein kinase ROS-like n=1 Tax=Contarinia nasturtii TaxID=265458 RepID=UPI0012D38E30|nr:proto-oncogene tyrosine-protein kinase ROS-like [Contarinia nasturtii]